MCFRLSEKHNEHFSALFLGSGEFEKQIENILEEKE
jgi:hypothetical protein